ncbi:MAG: DNA repair protein RecO, partial [Candidatus Zixiibacteriota bacterium]
MAIKKTEAFVLKSFNWSESSRTISFFTRDEGKLALTDRGGRSLSSKRGRALPFASLALTYYSSERSSNGYLSEVSVKEAWPIEGEGALGRLAFGSAARELLWLVLPDEEPHPDIYDYTLKFFTLLSAVERESLPALFLAYFLRLLSMLGYQPVLSGCVGCGKALERMQTARLSFSADRGGLVCGACQAAGESYIGFSLEDLT